MSRDERNDEAEKMLIRVVEALEKISKSMESIEQTLRWMEQKGGYAV